MAFMHLTMRHAYPINIVLNLAVLHYHSTSMLSGMISTVGLR